MIGLRSNNNNKPEQSNNQEKSVDNQYNNSYEIPQPQESFNSSQTTRAVSESETMARDIKEGRLSGFVGGGTTVTGEANFHAMLRIDGHLTGKVFSEKGTLIVGSTGQVDANVSVAVATINGTVNGDIVATEHLELKRTAKVVGNVQAPRLIMEDGAILEGSCSMINAKENLDKRNNAKINPPPTTTTATTTTTSNSSSTAAIDSKTNPFGQDGKNDNNQPKDKKLGETAEKDATVSKVI